MTSLLKKTSIVVLMSVGLLGAACGDDSNDNSNVTNNVNGNDGGETDSGDTGSAEDAGKDPGTGCVGGYAGFTAMDLSDKVKPAGACSNDVDVAGVCEKDPGAQARDVGLACFLAYGAGKPDEIRTCTLDGTASTDGLKKTLAPMSEACLTCYVDSVLCAVANCAGPCAADAAGKECGDCRLEFKCTETFFTCSGLPTSDELAAK